MTRFEAFLLLRNRVRDRGVVRRCLGVEAVMEDLAGRFEEDPLVWGVAGLVCEVDFEFTESNPMSKGKVAADIVRTEGGAPEIIEALSLFRGKGPFEDLMTRALAASLPAVMVVLDMAESAEELEGLGVEELVNSLDDGSVAPEASRTRILALEGDGLDAGGILGVAREAVLRVGEDVFGGRG